MQRSGRLVTAAAVLSLLVAGCGLAPGPGAGIAERIRTANSPIVREVVFSPYDPGLDGGPEQITVYLTDQATEEQALDLWCTVVAPPGAEQMPPGRVALYKGGKPATGGGRYGATRVLTNPVCPGDGSPAPSG